MEIYLVRHTTPAVEKGICYGQSDVDVATSFIEEALQIAKHLPSKNITIYASPLQRCHKLARHLFNNVDIELHTHLKEMNFGDWELKAWDDIDATFLQTWMNDFVNVSVPGGENYQQLYHRAVNTFQEIVARNKSAVIITHGGVIRSVLSYITHTSLKESFNNFKINYGCVVKISQKNEKWVYEIIHNMPQVL